ncbi:hypothetical protein ACHAXA_007371 [Cyclostephanos tholiformis]|uniref:Spindle assembly checkpoint component MAD1 n=1 Tax=Cyclostephanos tholiformis TaxID=382380 RepID=A0ABD3RRD2_9STRA
MTTQDHRKRPRLEEGKDPSQTAAPTFRSHPPPQSTLPTTTSFSTPAGAAFSSSSLLSSPSLMLLQTEVRALRTELKHSQSIRSIERRDAAQSESRLKRRLADAYEEASQARETIESLRAQVDRHSEAMEESRREWLQRLRWYEERWEREMGRDKDDEDDYKDRGRCALLQERLDAAMDQVRGLEDCIRDAEARRASAEEKATEATRLLRSSGTKCEEDEAENDGGGGGAVVEIPRDLRIRLAETERSNRELQRRNETLTSRAKDAIQDKERALSCGRKVALLEREVRDLTRQVEEGREATRRWAEFRNVLVEEGGSLLSSAAEGQGNGDDVVAMTTSDGGIPSFASSMVPPEIWTVVRNFKTLRSDASDLKEEIARVTQLAEAHSRRCQSLELQLNEGSRSIAKLEKMVDDREASISRLEVEYRKIVAREDIWKREAEGMRSLLNTYEHQETSLRQQQSSKERTIKNADGLQLSLDSAREELKLLSETNVKLVAKIDELEKERKLSKDELDQVLKKFHKLRDALMQERAKAETATILAAKAETLAGKGSFNPDCTRVLHLESNPLADAMREKFRKEIESLKRRLEEAETAAAASSSSLIADQQGGDVTTTTLTTTPDPANKSKSSLDSLTSRDSSNIDAQKLHARLKEQFRNQIALFRQGVYLITGFKIDMSQSQGGGSDSDCQIFTVRSIYGEDEGDHLMFKWSPKKKSKLDMLNTDMAHLLMNGPSGVYVKEHGSWPGFMASVTLQLFDQQTVL